MDNMNGQFCCGCLCTDRKMYAVNIWMKLCLSQIIDELPTLQTDVTALWLCWECEALARRFSKFKYQVKRSVKMLQNCTIHTNLQPQSKLYTQKLYNISYTPDANLCEIKYEIIKQEVPIETDIKVEYDQTDNTNYSDNYSDEDDKLLIDIRTKKKKKEKIINGHKKKRTKSEVLQIYKEIALTIEELEEERRLLLLRDEYVNAMFRCERCIVSFPNVDDLQDHISIKHNLNAHNYKCKVCECSFATEVSYNYHTNKHMKRYECTACMERLTSKRAATKHYDTAHCHGTDMGYELNKIPENGYVDEEQKPLECSPQDAPSFPCEFCHKTFRWKTSLRKHVETHRIENGQKRKPYCEPCRLSFTTTSNLQKHVKTSSKHQIQLKLRKLKESLPDGSASPEKQQARIEQIKRSVNSGRQQFPCGQCDKRFQWRGNLLRHLDSHAARANGELVCEPCNRTFSSIATYKQHMKISKKHVSENDFKYMCSDCGKKFANKTRLKDHVDWDHLKNYVHKCPVCQKVFKSHTSLYLHKQVVHKKDNAEHLCDHCGKPFPNHAKLRSHIIALHTTESPYKCSSCSARFSWHSCLSRHVRRVHRAPRPTRLKNGEEVLTS